MSKKEAEVLSAIEAFFSTIPEADAKKKLWDLFSGWVHFVSETADGREISQMLFFYQRLTELIDSLARLSRTEGLKD